MVSGIFSDTLSGIHVTYFLAFYLTYILTFFLAFFHLAFYLAFYLAYTLAFYLAVEVQRRAREVLGWGPAVPSGLERFPLEVQQCPLIPGDCCWGPAVPTAIRSWRGGEEVRRRRRRRRRKARRAILKSNNTHLTGGVKRTSFRLARRAIYCNCGFFPLRCTPVDSCSMPVCLWEPRRNTLYVTLPLFDVTYPCHIFAYCSFPIPPTGNQQCCSCHANKRVYPVEESLGSSKLAARSKVWK